MSTGRGGPVLLVATRKGAWLYHGDAARGSWRRLRELQDKTGGFNTFIPLKFRNKDKAMSDVDESVTTEDMRLYAIARIYLDNFPHFKAYWPMLGRQNAQLSLSFGVNDIDGTIDDSTKIYSMAGSEEQTPAHDQARTGNLN